MSVDKTPVEGIPGNDTSIWLGSDLCLAGWKDERTDIERPLAEAEQPEESNADLDLDEVIEELHFLEEHLASKNLYWLAQHSGGSSRP